MEFRATFAVPLNEASLRHMLAALTAINCDLLREYPSIPDLHSSGVKYRRETGEVWRAIPEILRSGYGDCEDLACWRAAELIVRKGVRAVAMPIRQPVAGALYHIVVDTASGYTEDPSRALGM